MQVGIYSEKKIKMFVKIFRHRKSPKLVLPGWPSKGGSFTIICNWKGSGSFVSKPLTTLADPFSSKTFGNSAAKNERHLFTLQFDNAGV